MDIIENRTFDEIKPGDTTSLVRTLSKEDSELFAVMSGDVNPAHVDEEFARSGMCSVLIITHKFREVMAYADAVTVLRRGKAVHHCSVASTQPAQLAAAMMGGRHLARRGA